MSRKLDFNHPIFVIEFCKDCSNHKWNTRHDEAKYASFAKQIADTIWMGAPDATVLFNQIPKKWQDNEIYMNLIWNEDPENDVFDMAPRLGAFEISTVAQEEVRSTIDKTKTLKN